METIIEKINQRLRYSENVTITRDEFNEIEVLIFEGDELYNCAQKEINNLENTSKQLTIACEILESIYECIDDDGAVTPSDKELLGRRIKSAVKFVENIRDSA